MPDVERLVAQPGFRDLPAVASGRVYLIDHSFFSRPGPRLVDGVELLHHLLWELPLGCAGAQASQQLLDAVVDPVPDVDRSVLKFQGGGDAGVANNAVMESAEACSAEACRSVSAGVAVDCSWRHDVLRIRCDAAKGTFQWVPL